MTTMNFRNSVVGIDIDVPVINGTRKYVNFDNAASTPPLKNVWEALERFKDYYSSVHRGTGYKSVVSTRAYDHAHEKALNFVGADPGHCTSIFVKNTTEAINKLARRIPFSQNDVVISSLMEHHSNDLPWRANAKTVHIEVDRDGFLDIGDLKSKLNEYRGRVKLVAISGASNVSGLMPPIKEIAVIAHQAGAEFFMDAAQLAPHRAIRMGNPGDEDAIDYLAFSGHKMYAPFGTGVLIGPKKLFKHGDPDLVGGGTVNYVTLSEVQWAHLPDKEEAGSPNVIGAVALSAAIDFFDKEGFSAIADHERELTQYALTKLSKLDAVELYGPSKWLTDHDRVGVISFNVKDEYHAKVAAILSYEGGIAVRNGCFCAHPYIQRLLNISDEASAEYRDQINHGNRSKVPGLVRISFGIYNTQSEIDYFINVLTSIIEKRYIGRYKMDNHSGQIYADNFSFPKQINL
jgi:cysteine desulfurase / selenocysteine lyase